MVFLLVISSWPVTGQPDLQPGDVWVVDRAWSADVRVSADAGADFEPAVWADENLSATVLWKANRSGEVAWWSGLTNTTAPATTAGSLVTNETGGAWGPNYTYAPNVGADAQGRIFVVYAESNNTTYVQLDGAGNVLVGPKVIVRSNGERILNPAIAVFPNGTAAVVYENATLPGPTRSEIYVVLVDDEGETVWGPRMVTSAGLYRAYFPTVAVNPWTEDILITFASGDTYLARFNKWGFKNMASQVVRSNWQPQIVYPVPMPNGNTQVFWAEYGKAYMSLFNDSGMRVVNGRVISDTNARNVTGVHGAGLSDGRSVAVWSDARTGDREIFFVTVRPGEEGNPGAPTNVRVTNATGNSTNPWIAADPWDNLHLVWSDERGGDAEVYYKRSYQCGAELWADRYDIAAMFFILPDETKHLPLRLNNTGYWSANLTLQLDVTGAPPGSGWAIFLNATDFVDVPRGGGVDASLQITSPASPKEGDDVWVNITASTNCSLGGEDLVNFPTYVYYPRAISLLFDQANQTALAGATVEFQGRVENLENLTEPVLLQHVFGAGNYGVTVRFNQTSLTVGPKSAKNVSASFHVPDDAVPGSVLVAQVVAMSQVDTTVRSVANLSVLVDPTVSIELDAHPDLRTAPWGTPLNYTVSVRNTGNIQEAARITLTIGASAITATIGIPDVWIAGGESADVPILAQIPHSAIDGDRFGFTLTATAVDFGSSASVTMWAVVEPDRQIAVDVDPASPGPPGGNTTLNISITNNGSANEQVGVVVTDTPAGWSAGEAAPANLSLGPGTANATRLNLTPPAGTAPGPYNITICICSEGRPPLELVVAVRVAGVVGLDLSVVAGYLASPPGRIVNFDLLLRSTGTKEVSVGISVAGMPPGASINLTLAEMLGDLPAGTPWNSSIVLAAGSSVALRLAVALTNETPAGDYTVQFLASTEEGASDVAFARLEVFDADLRAVIMVLSPPSPLEGQDVTVGLRFYNDARSNKSTVWVDLQDNGETIATIAVNSLVAGEERDVVFRWIASPGEHRLTMRIDPPIHGGNPWGEIREVDEENNELSVVVVIAGGAAGPEPTGAFGILLVVAVVAALAGTAGYVILRRRKGQSS